MEIKQKACAWVMRAMGRQQKTKGSVLAYSLIVLSMMFAIVGSMSIVTVLEKSSASSTQSSVQAFQVADSGVQMAIKKINSVISSPNNKLSNAFPAGQGECSVSGGVASVTDVLNSNDDMKYVLSFYEAGTTTPIANCNELVSKIADIKSVGTYKNNTVRAVQVSLLSDPSNLLLHGDGNTNEIVDSSLSPKSITVGGNAEQVSTQRKFIPGKSISFDGNSYLSTPHSNDFDFGADDFTIDAWVYGSSWTGLQTIFAKWKFLAGQGDYIFGIKDGKLVFYSGAKSELDPLVESSISIPTNTWTHVAVVKHNDDYTLYIDGLVKGTVTDSTALRNLNLKASVGMYMDALDTFNKSPFTGYIDELSVLKGRARWTAPFTPPAYPY